MTVLKQYDSGSSQWVPIVSGTTGATGPTGPIGATGPTGTVSLESPTFTGTPTLPTGTIATTQTALDSSTKVATTAFVTSANALKADLASPTFTGTPTLPTGTIATTQTAGNNTTAVATTAFVRTEVTNLIASAPAALDTLDELAAALGDDANFATTTATAIGLKAPLASPTFTGTVSGITKSMVGLGSVDNTADTAKPVSTAQQTALDLKASLASPALTGTPTAPTATAGTNTTQLATTAFVTTAIPAGVINPYGGSSAPTGWLLCYGQAVSRTTYAALFAVLSTTYNTGGEAGTDFRLPDLRGRTVAGIGNMGGVDAVRLDIANSSGTVVGSQYVTLTSAQSGVPAHSHANTLGSNSVSTPGHQHAEHLMHGTTSGSAGMVPFAPWNDPVWGISPTLKSYANRQGFSMAGAEGSTISGYPYLTSGELTAATTVTISNVNNTPANAVSAHNNMQPTMVLNYIIKA